MLTHLNEEWNTLADLVQDKGSKLGQADSKKALMQQIDDAQHKLAEIERQLVNNEEGTRCAMGVCSHARTLRQ